MVAILLPEKAINILPLSAEPLSQWKRTTDIRRFVDALYTDIYPPFSTVLYKREKREIMVWSKQFKIYAQKATAAPKSANQIISIPNFLDDANFGKAAKYVTAWKYCVQTLLEEAGFYSLAHLLESSEELDCSLLLASRLYYKQAIQVLRNFVEEIVLPINFCENVHEFNQWKTNSYRTPPLRGREGLVKKLLDKRILTEPLAVLVSNLYGDLNSYIHGSESRLIHKNAHTTSWDGLIFKYSDFSEWAEYVSRTIDVGIKLLRVNYLQWDNIYTAKWDNLRQQGKVLCSSCHNEDDFDVKYLTPDVYNVEVQSPDGRWVKADASFPGYATYICCQCGHQTTIMLEPKVQE